MRIPKSIKFPRKLKKELKRVNRVCTPAKWLHEPDINTVSVMHNGYDYLFEKPTKSSHRLKLILIREDKRIFKLIVNNYIESISEDWQIIK